MANDIAVMMCETGCMKILNSILAGIAVLLLWIGFVLAVNYFDGSIIRKSSDANPLPAPGNEISVLNWNIGYGGLGAESDFIMDGGENLQPPSRQIVEKNLAGIQQLLGAHSADFVLLQEISEPDLLTLGADILAGVRAALPGYNYAYSSDFRTRFLPARFALRHGLASFHRIGASPMQIRRLINETDRLGGVVVRQYHLQRRDFNDANGREWVIINLHLSAFDEGGNIRLKQLEDVITYGESLYAQGKHVVLGGDWNIQLTPPDFPHTTEEKYLFWRTAFPQDRLKTGWQLVFDPAVPTMRSNERPYQRGENFTAIIDGFLVSPNVAMRSVETIDTDFQFTDHQPVRAVFHAAQ